MCTLILLRRPDHAWPVLLAANRDEKTDRPWQSPGRHWPDRDNVVAGLDELGGGSWFGLNDDGVVAGIMNRVNTLGPATDKRSRGELVLEALDHAEAKTAAEALAHIDPEAYRAFNLVIADADAAYWVRHAETDEGIEVKALPPGLTMFTAYDCNDTASARVRRYLPELRAATAPDPDHDDWAEWERILASRESDVGPEGAMTVVTNVGFGTVSSALLALPSRERYGEKPRLRFAAGRPGDVPYVYVPL